MIICNKSYVMMNLDTAWKVSKYGVISGPYFVVFGLNTRKYEPEITAYLDNFQTVRFKWILKHPINLPDAVSQKYLIKSSKSFIVYNSTGNSIWET